MVTTADHACIWSKHMETITTQENNWETDSKVVGQGFLPGIIIINAADLKILKITSKITLTC